MFQELVTRVKDTTPLIHNITNYVTVNDVANVLLACGGSPIMSDDIDDVVDITTICGGLNINIGTLNARTIPSMLAAAVCLMGLAGEIAWSRMQEGDGNSTYRNRIIDAICHIDGDTLEKGARYELR